MDKSYQLHSDRSKKKMMNRVVFFSGDESLEASHIRATGACKSGKTYLSSRSWLQKLLHKGFDVTDKTELCRNFSCQI